MGSCDFKMLSLNVRGLKRQNLHGVENKMHSTRDKEKKRKTECGVPLELAHGSNNAKGVAILLRNGFDCKIKQNFVDPAGRYIGVQAQINDELHNLMIISLPS